VPLISLYYLDVYGNFKLKLCHQGILGFFFKLTFTFILMTGLPQMAFNKPDHFALMNFGFGFYEKGKGLPRLAGVED
jgi:hypothetical protein